MCGIFGVISAGTTRFVPKQAQRLIELFYLLSESRGKEAAGAALHEDARVDVVKAAVRGRDFLRLPEAQPVLASLGASLCGGKPVSFMGHTRMVTNGGDHVHGNNQPVIRGNLTAIHNGIVVNDAELWSRVPGERRAFEVDTEVILALVSDRLKKGTSFSDAALAAMGQITGANSVALMSADHEETVLATSNGSMFLAHDEPGGITLFASERSILERLVREALAPLVAQPPQVWQLQPSQSVIASPARPAPLMISAGIGSTAAVVGSRPSGRLQDRPVNTAPDGSPAQVGNRLRQDEIARTVGIRWEGVRALRRCTRCVLPETFPFLRFDAHGVCNICNAHKPLALKGADALRSLLDGLRRTDGRPEVLFPLSGGRDSCYGLHVLVKDFGVRPVAYTYDWGMVTDLARRNISRMCGQLGIEHILISADIRRKREYVRKNVAAWLKKPHLGTIPLFMAGDKQFFYYANVLKKEMGLGATLFSMNPLERTDFKVGFCGIDETYHKERHYDPKFANKLRLGAFYAGQFLANPAYLNASLLDSAFAYFSYYLIPKDFTSMFDYLPWHEPEVESTLLGQYDWEISRDTRSTWRIGDGTAAFYNYVYLRVAGFSENDTFRSNQIRAGLLTREAAMARIEQDNQPRVESLAWYFDAIGLDAVEALRTVNRIPPAHPALQFA